MVTFDKFNAPLLNKNFRFFKAKKKKKNATIQSGVCKFFLFFLRIGVVVNGVSCGL